MSSALVRQALEFVDQEEIGGKRNRKRAATTRPTTVGQDYSHPYKKQQKNRKPKLVKKVSSEQTIENIKKLLELSKPPTDTAIAEKLVQRAVKGKPLLEKIEVKKEEYKSILFPDEEPYSKFEKEYFCS